MKILPKFLKNKTVKNLLASSIFAMGLGLGTNANAAPIDPNLIKGIAGSIGTAFNESYYSFFYSPDSANVNTLESAEKAIEYIKLKTKFDYILNKSLKIINSNINNNEKMKKFNVADSYELKGIKNSTYLIVFINKLLEDNNLQLTQKEKHFLEIQKLALMGYLAKMTMFMEKNSFANRKILTDIYKILKNSKILEPTYADIKIEKNHINTKIHYEYQKIAETTKKIFEKEEVIEKLAKNFKTSKKEIKKFIKFAFADKEIQLNYDTPNVSTESFRMYNNPDTAMFFDNSKNKKEFLKDIKEKQEKKEKLIAEQEKVKKIIKEEIIENKTNINRLSL